tara:strand:- start:21 stop:473 length:453 start_codon:yes stop_codon:yes gene_type:complete
MSEFRINIEQNSKTTWTFVFESDNRSVRVWASDFMDPIGLLFYDLRMILKHGQTRGIVSMIDEPEENIWVLNKSNDVIEIDVLNFKDYSGNNRDLTKGIKIFSGKMKFNRFLNQLINSLNPYKKETKISELINELVELRKKQPTTPPKLH